MLHFTALHCTALHSNCVMYLYTALCCAVPSCTALHTALAALCYAVPCCTPSHCTGCTVLPSPGLHCFVQVRCRCPAWWGRGTRTRLPHISLVGATTCHACCLQSAAYSLQPALALALLACHTTKTTSITTKTTSNVSRGGQNYDDLYSC